jgi:hypothetical protein
LLNIRKATKPPNINPSIARKTIRDTDVSLPVGDECSGLESSVGKGLAHERAFRSARSFGRPDAALLASRVCLSIKIDEEIDVARSSRITVVSHGISPDDHVPHIMRV